jgi:hypothetical protein
MMGDRVRTLLPDVALGVGPRSGRGGGIATCSGIDVLVRCTYTLGHKRYHLNLYLDAVPMKAVQVRMARAAVGWGVRELAKKSRRHCQHRHTHRKRSGCEAIHNGCATAGT